jgi:IPTL-CTERM motif
MVQRVVVYQYYFEDMVRRFLSVFLLMAGFLMAGGANAAPLTWTIPNTTLPNQAGSAVTSASISGTFDYDADTQAVSRVNVTVVLNGTSYPITSSAPIFGDQYLVFTNSVSSGSPTGWVFLQNLTNAGGPAEVLALAGLCAVEDSSCNSYDYGYGPATLTSSTPTPPTPPSPTKPIPTLSEWAQIMMMLMMIATAGFYGWRMKQR